MRWTILIFLLLVGCPSVPKRHIAVSPTVTVLPSGQVDLKGDAQTPPKVDTRKSDGRMTIPEGSRFELNEKLGVMSLTMAKASEMVLNRTETAIQGPVAFTPDRGPTVREEMDAKAGFWIRLGLMAGAVGGAAASIFGLVRAWDYVMYGGAAVSAACLFGLFVQTHPILLLIIGLGVAIAVAGPVLWHTKLKKLNGSQNSPNAIG